MCLRAIDAWPSASIRLRTQVWDASVSRESDDRLIAMFRCTQFILPAEDPRTEQQRMRRKEIDEDRGG